MIESRAKEIDELLCLLKSPRFKYISYRNTTSQERLKAMYHNDNNNAKGKYEILENMSLNDEVINETNDKMILLEHVLIKVEKGGQYLFLAAEQGDGRYKNRVIVVLNPKMQQQARK